MSCGSAAAVRARAVRRAKAKTGGKTGGLLLLVAVYRVIRGCSVQEDKASQWRQVLDRVTTACHGCVSVSRPSRPSIPSYHPSSAKPGYQPNRRTPSTVSLCRNRPSPCRPLRPNRLSSHTTLLLRFLPSSQHGSISVPRPPRPGTQTSRSPTNASRSRRSSRRKDTRKEKRRDRAPSFPSIHAPATTRSREKNTLVRAANISPMPKPQHLKTPLYDFGPSEHPAPRVVEENPSVHRSLREAPDRAKPACHFVSVPVW